MTTLALDDTYTTDPAAIEALATLHRARADMAAGDALRAAHPDHGRPVADRTAPRPPARSEEAQRNERTARLDLDAAWDRLQRANARWERSRGASVAAAATEHRRAQEAYERASDRLRIAEAAR